jgi:ATP-dependent Clp protease ATP-binding subunit ClpB
MTSNLTKDQLYGRAPILDGNGMVKPPIRPEFLNRIDEIINFQQLNKEQIADIVRLQMKKVSDMLAEQGFTLNCTDAAIDTIAEAGFDPDFGARPVKRAIQHLVLNELSRKILADAVDRTKPIIIDEFGEGLIFRN